jgi:arylsulfatase A-like enzyme
MGKYNLLFFLIPIFINSCKIPGKNDSPPNIILIMTDDQGWGQTGYYNHPLLKTPNLDAMAESGIRFDRFYAGAPVCSPTRASVLTGRNNDRTGVYTHGNALRKQEKTISTALKQRGYATGHFGKWHINGLVGPGVPILEDDPYRPGVFGFDEWISVTNFFDIDPLMSDNGRFKEYEGTSSDVIVDLALDFIGKSIEKKKPFFAVIWDGSPHYPFLALEKDMEGFDDLDEESRNHYGELVAFDRSVGTLRDKLRELGVADNTLIWYSSDNGGLPEITPSAMGNLKGHKRNLWEGGLRVPAIIEWPDKIKPAVTNYPASTMDIFPTIADLLNLPDSAMVFPQDGQSIKAVMIGNAGHRQKPIPFRFDKGGALIDNDFKLYIADRNSGEYQLYNLADDPKESTDVSADYPVKFEELKNQFTEFNASVENSIKGLDYPEGKLTDKPYRQGWMTDPRYRQYLDDWVKRPEYRDRIIKENRWNEK